MRPNAKVALGSTKRKSLVSSFKRNFTLGIGQRHTTCGRAHVILCMRLWRPCINKESLSSVCADT